MADKNLNDNMQEAISLFLITPNEQNIILSDIQLNWTVLTLKEHIQSILGCDTLDQALFMILGLELDNDKTLSSYGLQKWTSIYLVLKLTGSGSLVIFIEIFYPTSSRGRIVLLEVQETDDVENVKNSIERSHHIPVESQSLYYGKQVLHDDVVLSTLYVRYFSTIRCVVSNIVDAKSSNKVDEGVEKLIKKTRLPALKGIQNKKTPIKNADSFSICVRTINGVVHVQVKGTDTVGILKNQLMELLGVDVTQQSLFLKLSDELKSEDTLAYSGIIANSSVYLFIRFTDMGVLTVFVDIVSEAKLETIVITPVEISVHESVMDLKRAVARQEGLELSKLSLYVRDEKTNDWKLVEEDTCMHNLRLQFFSKFRCLVSK